MIANVVAGRVTIAGTVQVRAEVAAERRRTRIDPLDQLAHLRVVQVVIVVAAAVIAARACTPIRAQVVVAGELLDIGAK